MTILAVHHIQITVPRTAEAEARAFYCGFLGLPEIDKPASLQSRGGFWVRLGVVELHIGLEEGVDRWQTKAHVAYRVADLAAWRQKLVERRVVITESVPIAGLARFEFRDPFGNRVELLQLEED